MNFQFIRHHESFYFMEYYELTITILNAMKYSNSCGIFVRKDRTKIDTEFTMRYNYLDKSIIDDRYSIHTLFKPVSIRMFAVIMAAKQFADENFEIDYTYVKG